MLNFHLTNTTTALLRKALAAVAIGAEKRARLAEQALQFGVISPRDLA